MYKGTDVTVIVPAYKAVDTIAATLRSIAEQTASPAHVIVVDDGSPDATADVVERLKNEMNGIALSLIRQENRGAGAARNCALFAATTPLVAFLDSDDRWATAKLERSLVHMNSGSYTLVAHDFLQAPPGGTETLVACSALFLEATKTNAYHGLYRKGFVGTSTVLAERQALIDAGGFDETLFAAQDFDLWLKVLADPEKRFSVFDEPLTHYTQNASGITSNIDKRLECTLRVAKRHFGALSKHTGVSPLSSFLFRMLAVHYEAYTACRAKGQNFRALSCVLSLPFKAWSA